jgi:hypothetical protein
MVFARSVLELFKKLRYLKFDGHEYEIKIAELF